VARPRLAFASSFRGDVLGACPRTDPFPEPDRRSSLPRVAGRSPPPRSASRSASLLRSDSLTPTSCSNSSTNVVRCMSHRCTRSTSDLDTDATFRSIADSVVVSRIAPDRDREIVPIRSRDRLQTEIACHRRDLHQPTRSPPEPATPHARNFTFREVSPVERSPRATSRGNGEVTRSWASARGGGGGRRDIGWQPRGPSDRRGV
jgi:hypothetical protein